jgi:hypothetical protein
VYVRIVVIVIALAAAGVEWAVGTRGAWIGMTLALGGLISVFLPRRNT